MGQSKRFYILAFTQLILACVMTRQWFLTGDGVDLFLAAITALLAILVGIAGYRFRNSQSLEKSDPRVLRTLAIMGGVTGTLALLTLLWRVHGEWILLGQSANLLLALLCILGFVCAVFGALLLKKHRVR